MFQILDGFPDDVLAISVQGRITADDYRKMLNPEVEARLARHRPLKLFFHIGPNFGSIAPGAMVEDMKLGFSHLQDWGRMAVVTDLPMIRELVNLFRVFLKRPLKIFFDGEYEKAKAWILLDEEAAQAAE